MKELRKRMTEKSGINVWHNQKSHFYLVDDNPGKNVDKFTKLSKLGISLKCLQPIFCSFLTQLSKFDCWLAGRVLAVNFNNFRDFLEIS